MIYRLLFALVALFSLGFAQGSFQQGPYGAPQWSRFQKGTQSLIKDSGQWVFKTEGEWQRWWKQLTGNSPDTAPKGIDWNTECLIALTLGQRSTGGFAIDVDTIRVINADKAEVVYSEQVPNARGNVSQGLTQPWVVVRMKRLPVTLSFVRGMNRAAINLGGNPPDWYNSGGTYPCPLKWFYVTDGRRCRIKETMTFTLSSPSEFSDYWAYSFGDSPSAEVLRSVDWREEILGAIHCGPLAKGTIGIESVMLGSNGRVTVSWYEKAGANGFAIQEKGFNPYLILRLPRYSTGVSFIKLPGGPR